MAIITILDHTYTLPAIATEHFRTLQDQVREQQQVIQTGRRPLRLWSGYPSRFSWQQRVMFMG